MARVEMYQNMADKLENCEAHFFEVWLEYLNNLPSVVESRILEITYYQVVRAVFI